MLKLSSAKSQSLHPNKETPQRLVKVFMNLEMPANANSQSTLITVELHLIQQKEKAYEKILKKGRTFGGG